MRTKDRPVLLRRAMADVAAQEFADWQLIIVNDGGAPEPVEALMADLDADMAARINVLHHPESLGMEAASNAGVEASSSEFVCVHDDDDTWDRRFLSATVGHLEAHPDDAAVVTRAEIVVEEFHGSHVVETGRTALWPDLVAISLSDLIRTNRFVPIQVLYRRDVHDVIGPFRDDLPVVGDWEFHLRLAQAFTIGLLDDVLAFWHQRPSAVGTQANSIAADHRHRAADLRVRDALLREHVAANGMGDLLYLTRYLQGEFDHLHHRLNDLNQRFDAIDDRIEAVNQRLEHTERRLEQVEAVARDSGLTGTLRRKYYALRDRFGD